MARSDVKTLPLMSVNHISFAVPSPQDTANFFESVLGFKRLKRPAAFENSFDGAWVCGMGLEVHFVQPTSIRKINRPNRLANLDKDQPIDPRNDHLSFLCTDNGRDSPWLRVIDMLRAWGVQYVERSFPEDDLRQLSASPRQNPSEFHAPHQLLSPSHSMQTLRPAFIPIAPSCARLPSTQYFPWKQNPLNPFPKPIRPRTALSTPQPMRNGNGKPPPPSRAGGGDFSEGELFAASPELERLAMKSSAAPILTRVVSYNVLSSSLAAPSHFPECKPSDLDASNRLKRVLMKLEAPVASRSIICLQEVSLAWSGDLHQFFASRGFHLLLASHGSYFSGYMGEGLAFPLDLYEPLELRIERLTDTMKWPNRQRRSGFFGSLAEFHSRFRRATQVLFDVKPNRFRHREPWDHARGRHNRFIFARLKSRTNGARICVANYHMPCVYWSPPVMMIHAALVVRNFQVLCEGDDGVLAGDFNIRPTDSSYEMITTGVVNQTHHDFPASTPDGTPASKWFPQPLAPMKSAYREVLGQEPDFTNYAKVENQPMFVETLDYVFCTLDVDVVDVLRLPHRDAVQGPFPDASEPSDHVMIGATLRLPAPVRLGARSPLPTGKTDEENSN